MLLSFTLFNSKSFCLDTKCHTIVNTGMHTNEVKTLLLARFVTGLEDTLLFVVWVHVRHSPSLRHKTIKSLDTELSLQWHGTCISDNGRWMTCVETEWVREDSVRPLNKHRQKVNQ